MTKATFLMTKYQGLVFVGMLIWLFTEGWIESSVHVFFFTATSDLDPYGVWSEVSDCVNYSSCTTAELIIFPFIFYPLFIAIGVLCHVLLGPNGLTRLGYFLGCLAGFYCILVFAFMSYAKDASLQWPYWLSFFLICALFRAVILLALAAQTDRSIGQAAQSATSVDINRTFAIKAVEKKVDVGKVKKDPMTSQSIARFGMLRAIYVVVGFCAMGLALTNLRPYLSNSLIGGLACLLLIGILLVPSGRHSSKS